ncbi:hypothetical protein Hokovirus_3_115 [Hokovirus HKV1]|uniref:Uncharacterized protein n=1 Tax=Hokovirus HKV1 TaxID=1977638 RepID=A0A1V0SGJ7_9VIRU|nr:hypothetical protein Hokovirus_3_115 [Hokovirus HKV1]
MNITILLKSTITIPLILSVLVFGILFMMYKMNKIDNQIYTPLNIGLITAITFIVSWFIVDTILTNKNNKEMLYDNIHKNNREHVESNEINSKLQIKQNKPTKEMKQNKMKQNMIKETVTTEINNNRNIKNILEEPLNQIPEYKYMTTNNVQIPEDVDLYLDRGKI